MESIQIKSGVTFALYLDDPAMKGFAAWLAKDKSFWADPAALYAKSGNFPTLGRELMLLRQVSALSEERPVEPLAEAWLPDLQIAVMRGKDKFVAVKGGSSSQPRP